MKIVDTVSERINNACDAVSKKPRTYSALGTTLLTLVAGATYSATHQEEEYIKVPRASQVLDNATYRNESGEQPFLHSDPSVIPIKVNAGEQDKVDCGRITIPFAPDAINAKYLLRGGEEDTRPTVLCIVQDGHSGTISFHPQG